MRNIVIMAQDNNSDGLETTIVIIVILNYILNIQDVCSPGMHGIQYREGFPGKG